MPIPDTSRFATIEPLDKGWSSDKKYIVTTHDGERQLLRVSAMAELERKQNEFAILRRVEALGIPASRPLDFWTEGDSVYQLLSWIEGESANVVLPTLSEAEQYARGLQAGEILRRIHSIPAPDDAEDWAMRFTRKTRRKIDAYRACGLRFDGDDAVIAYIENSYHLLENRPQSYQHGDYQVHNMVLTPKTVSIIDFGYGFGDPLEEFESIRWCVDASQAFSRGMVDGYFHGDPPREFWQTILLYFASGMFHNLLWAIPHGEDEICATLRHIRDVQAWYDDFTRTVPTWYGNS